MKRGIVIEFPSFGIYLGKYVGIFYIIICAIALFWCIKIKASHLTFLKWFIALSIFTVIAKQSSLKIDAYNSWARSIGITSNNEDIKTEAWVYATDYVKANLKAPSTAKFCKSIDAVITSMGNDKYEVSGYVDSENGFGANIRTDFTVSLVLTEDGYKEASLIIN